MSSACMETYEFKRLHSFSNTFSQLQYSISYSRSFVFTFRNMSVLALREETLRKHIIFTSDTFNKNINVM